MGKLKSIDFERCTSGIEFEDWTKDLLRDLSFNADRVGKNDSGVDIIAKAQWNGKVYRFYIQLQEVTLSSDARAVLNKATEIVRKSFKYRNDFNKKHPEYHINTWDAGWYQIKGMCKEYPELKQELDAFTQLYKQFEDRMRPLVYELGFLYK